MKKVKLSGFVSTALKAVGNIAEGAGDEAGGLIGEALEIVGGAMKSLGQAGEKGSDGGRTITEAEALEILRSMHAKAGELLDSADA